MMEGYCSVRMEKSQLLLTLKYSRELGQITFLMYSKHQVWNYYFQNTTSCLEFNILRIILLSVGEPVPFFTGSWLSAQAPSKKGLMAPALLPINFFLPASSSWLLGFLTALAPFKYVYRLQVPLKRPSSWLRFPNNDPTVG